MSALPGNMRGVTLVEMAMVLLILGVLMRAAIMPLTTVQEHRQHRVAEEQLARIRQGLWAHVVATGALPCPLPQSVAQAHSSMLLANASEPLLPLLSLTQSDCTTASGGVPAALLGLPGAIDRTGALLDPWQRPYRLAVSLADHPERGLPGRADWTTPGEASRIGISELSADLTLCTKAVPQVCSSRDMRANRLVFVVLSTGADDSTAGEQIENLDADNVFVLQEPSILAGSPFDDQLVWGTAADTLYWMLRAAWLP